MDWLVGSTDRFKHAQAQIEKVQSASAVISSLKTAMVNSKRTAFATQKVSFAHIYASTYTGSPVHLAMSTDAKAATPCRKWPERVPATSIKLEQMSNRRNKGTRCHNYTQYGTRTASARGCHYILLQIYCFAFSGCPQRLQP